MSFDFIATADIHLSDQTPSKRQKGYTEQILNKFEQILEITKEQTHSNILVIAGDFFDSPTVSYDLTREVIKIINRCNVEIIVIPGQHDLRYHQSGLKNTPLGILFEAGLVKSNSESDLFVCAGWNEEPTMQKDILITHRMVFKDHKLFPGEKDYIMAKDLLKKYPWAKIIISGDNHTPHLVSHKNRFQLNCGSVVRKTKDQVDYKPAVWGIKLKPTIAIIKIPLTIISSEKVFNFNKIEKEEIEDKIKKEAEERIKNFIKVLPDMEQEKPNFPNILQKIVKETNPGKEVENIINSVMERII